MERSGNYEQRIERIIETAVSQVMEHVRRQRESMTGDGCALIETELRHALLHATGDAARAATALALAMLRESIRGAGETRETGGDA